MLTVGGGGIESAEPANRVISNVWLISSGAKHPNWVVGHVGGKVEDGEHSFADVRRGMKSQGVEEFYDFIFSLLFFPSACHAGMLEAFVGGRPSGALSVIRHMLWHCHR